MCNIGISIRFSLMEISGAVFFCCNFIFYFFSNTNKCCFVLFRQFCSVFLAPPAEWQRSFTNAESSVVVIIHHPSTFYLKVRFFLNCLITFFLILHRDSMAWGLPANKCWSPSNRPKAPPHVPQKWPPVAVFIHFAKFLKICPITFSLFWHGAS